MIKQITCLRVVYQWGKLWGLNGTDSVKLSHTEFKIREFQLSASGQEIYAWFCEKKQSAFSQFYYAV